MTVGTVGITARTLYWIRDWTAAKEQDRNREAYTRLMLGSRYVMLRREFRAWRNWKRATRPIAQRLLITIGGSDPDGLTFRVIEALSKRMLPDIATTVLVGGSNPRRLELQRVMNSTPLPFDIVCDPPNVPEWMAKFRPGGDLCRRNAVGASLHGLRELKL